MEIILALLLPFAAAALWPTATLDSGAPACHEVSASIGSHMVLQRAPESARVFGSVCGGLANATSVSVDVDGGAPTTVPIVAGATSWAVSLPPQPASLAPRTLRVRGGESFVQTIDDVLFGDVILCSGQSNMVFSVNQMTGARDEIARANASRFRAIRLFTVAPRTASAPAADPVVMQPWQLANSESVGGGAASVAFTYFSAVCWLQGSHLFDRLGGSVPLGLITSAVGGTRIHCWSSPDALGQCPQYLPPRAVSSGDSDLFNSMIAPLLSMRLKFIVWLQSESDVCASDASCIPQRGARYYSCAIQAMVRDWRAKFNATSPALPFIWVQIAPWEGHEAATTSRALPAMRLAQMAANALPRVAMATAVDLGSAANAKGWNTGDEHGPDPWGNVHFRRKGPLGPRLSAAALAVVYGNASVPYRGPEAERVSTIARPCEGGADGAAVVRALAVAFKEETLGGGLRWNAQAECPYLVLKNEAGFTAETPDCPTSIDRCIAKCGWWDVETSDGVWHLNVTALLSADNTSVELALPSGVACAEAAPRPTAARYLFADWPVATLYNREGFPALPFLLNVST